MACTSRDLSTDEATIFRGIEWFLQAFVGMQAPLLFVIFQLFSYQQQ